MLSIREQYEKHGVVNYYQNQADDYQNPHSSDIAQALKLVIDKIDWSLTFDLACGNGLITNLLKHQYNIQVTNACDPYLSKQYKKHTGQQCHEWSFSDICRKGFDQSYSCIVASYSIHLAQELFDLLYQIAIHTKYLLILSPTKHPHINDHLFSLNFEHKIGKTYIRLYLSCLFFQTKI